MLSVIPRRPLGRVRTASLLKARTIRASGGNALVFPANVTGQSQVSPYGVIEFDAPENNGLPPAGPSNLGITVIRRIKPIQSTGYYAQFWYVGDSTSFDPTKYYWGFHPYPSVGSNGGNQDTNHHWEIAATHGADYTAYDAIPYDGIPVVKGVWHSQAAKVEYNGGTPLLTFYADLPTIDIANEGRTVVRATTDAGDFALTPPTGYKIVIGNSPWMSGYQEERAAMELGEIKIIAKALSEADILSEAADMSTLVTSDAQTYIWWGKKGFTSVDDLTCDFGTGRSFTRNDASNILTLGEAL